MERYFKLSEKGSTVRTEVIAGITTFLTMAYIIFVNPDILATTGMDRNAVFVATCLAAALGSLIMGLWANWPIGMAPGMGLNAFFAFTVVGVMGFTWQQALGAVFISGMIFLILSVTGIRRWLIAGIPSSMRSAIAAGIGLFLAIIALQSVGIVVDNPATLVALGDLTATGTLLTIGGFFLIVALDALKVTGAILIGILVVTIAVDLPGRQPVRRHHVDAALDRADLPAAGPDGGADIRHLPGGAGHGAGRGVRRHRHADRRRQARGPADRRTEHRTQPGPRADGRFDRDHGGLAAGHVIAPRPMSKARRACRRAGAPA